MTWVHEESFRLALVHGQSHLTLVHRASQMAFVNGRSHVTFVHRWSHLALVRGGSQQLALVH